MCPNIVADTHLIKNYKGGMISKIVKARTTIKSINKPKTMAIKDKIK